MKHNYTPGPWSVIEPLYLPKKEVYVGIKETRMGRTDYHVCKILGHGADYENDPEQQANALLISLAPQLADMLDLLIKANDETKANLPGIETARALLAELGVTP